jgi:hypothetical protein
MLRFTPGPRPKPEALDRKCSFCGVSKAQAKGAFLVSAPGGDANICADCVREMLNGIDDSSGEDSAA